jgi:hypothetical protein
VIFLEIIQEIVVQSFIKKKNERALAKKNVHFEILQYLYTGTNQPFV